MTSYCCEEHQHNYKALDKVSDTPPASALALLSVLSPAAHPDVLVSWVLASGSGARAEGGISWLRLRGLCTAGCSV